MKSILKRWQGCGWLQLRVIVLMSPDFTGHRIILLYEPVNARPKPMHAYPHQKSTKDDIFKLLYLDNNKLVCLEI